MEQKIKKQLLICYVAGHSGGHIIPCLTLAAQEKRIHGHHILFLSSNKTLDRKIIENSSYVDYHVSFCVSQKRKWYSLPLLAIGLAHSFIKAFFVLWWYQPERVLSTGSIVAIPCVLAAYCLRIPIELFEVNAIPGKTILFLARFATTISICFEQTKKYFQSGRCTKRTYPIRFTTTFLPKPSSLAHFDTKRLTLFVHGGSQGSSNINTLIQNVIATHPLFMQFLQVIHQTGSQAYMWHQWYAQRTIPAHVFDYEYDTGAYYQCADLVICRAGAGALFETLYFKKSCITIPLTTATTGHQLNNAQAIAAEYPELFCIIEQNGKTSAKLKQRIADEIAKKFTHSFLS